MGLLIESDAMKSILVIGAGGHGRSIAEAILMSKDSKLVGFVDDSVPPASLVLGYPVLGTSDDLEICRAYADYGIVAVGNNGFRCKMTHQLVEIGFSLVSVIHPSAVVSPRAVIGPGSAIMAGAIVGTEAVLGMGVIVNSGAVVDHHCQVADFGHLGVNVSMAGGARVGRGAWVQAGSALGYGVAVADGVVLNPGTAVYVS